MPRQDRILVYWDGEPASLDRSTLYFWRQISGEDLLALIDAQMVAYKAVSAELRHLTIPGRTR